MKALISFTLFFSFLHSSVAANCVTIATDWREKYWQNNVYPEPGLSRSHQINHLQTAVAKLTRDRLGQVIRCLSYYGTQTDVASAAVRSIESEIERTIPRLESVAPQLLKERRDRIADNRELLTALADSQFTVLNVVPALMADVAAFVGGLNGKLDHLIEIELNEFEKTQDSKFEIRAMVLMELKLSGADEEEGSWMKELFSKANRNELDNFERTNVAFEELMRKQEAKVSQLEMELQEMKAKREALLGPYEAQRRNLSSQRARAAEARRFIELLKKQEVDARHALKDIEVLVQQLGG